MKIDNAILRVVPVATFCVLSLVSASAAAQDKPWTEGTVWNVTLVRVKPGMFDVYMREVVPVRKKIDEEAKKQGLLVSSHILAGNANGRDDWDVMFLAEYKNWAAFDGMTAKYDAIAKNIVGPEDKQVQMMTKRADVREIMGDKLMQELVVK